MNKLAKQKTNYNLKAISKTYCMLIISLFFIATANSQESYNPIKKKRERTVQDIGDYAQHAPA